jgi:hypothetical protein
VRILRGGDGGNILERGEVELFTCVGISLPQVSLGQPIDDASPFSERGGVRTPDILRASISIFDRNNSTTLPISPISSINHKKGLGGLFNKTPHLIFAAIMHGGSVHNETVC